MRTSDDGEPTCAVDPVLLSALWDERWPGRSKLPYELRSIPDRWVRFHSLPRSKRYPETEAQYKIVLARHNTVLADLANDSAILVVTVSYSDSRDSYESRSPQTLAVHPDAVYWTSVCMDDEPDLESWMHLHVSRERWTPGCLDTLLRHVVDEVVANVVIADPDLRWLYHPYDGGMDVILPSATERDALRHRYHEWLSEHPSGQ
ncbi:hypothetical protein [Actinoplanes sp. NPDC049802]|uniref:DUF3885 domain-containing protein n=1 Tax=Actinoplanes sp. NPDC049802 TaxID=3154742 RepID=UPI0033C510F3